MGTKGLDFAIFLISLLKSASGDELVCAGGPQPKTCAYNPLVSVPLCCGSSTYGSATCCSPTKCSWRSGLTTTTLICDHMTNTKCCYTRLGQASSCCNQKQFFSTSSSSYSSWLSYSSSSLSSYLSWSSSKYGNQLSSGELAGAAVGGFFGCFLLIVLAVTIPVFCCGARTVERHRKRQATAAAVVVENQMQPNPSRQRSDLNLQQQPYFRPRGPPMPQPQPTHSQSGQRLPMPQPPYNQLGPPSLMPQPQSPHFQPESRPSMPQSPYHQTVPRTEMPQPANNQWSPQQHPMLQPQSGQHYLSPPRPPPRRTVSELNQPSISPTAQRVPVDPFEEMYPPSDGPLPPKPDLIL